MFNLIRYLIDILIDNLIENEPVKMKWVQSDLEIEYRKMQANFKQ